MADPEREAWVDRHRTRLLVLAAMLCAVAFFLALAINAWLELLLPAGIMAVVIYGARPSESRRTRPKDVLLAKNLLTGLAYATLVTSVDDAVGRLLGALDDLGIADETLVVYTSDNGGLSAHGRGGPRARGGL